jgi:hypothetical protein
MCCSVRSRDHIAPCLRLRRNFERPQLTTSLHAFRFCFWIFPIPTTSRSRTRSTSRLVSFYRTPNRSLLELLQTTCSALFLKLGQLSAAELTCSKAWHYTARNLKIYPSVITKPLTPDVRCTSVARVFPFGTLPEELGIDKISSMKLFLHTDSFVGSSPFRAISSVRFPAFLLKGLFSAVLPNAQDPLSFLSRIEPPLCRHSPRPEARCRCRK